MSIDQALAELIDGAAAPVTIDEIRRPPSLVAPVEAPARGTRNTRALASAALVAILAGVGLYAVMRMSGQGATITSSTDEALPAMARAWTEVDVSDDVFSVSPGVEERRTDNGTAVRGVNEIQVSAMQAVDTGLMAVGREQAGLGVMAVLWTSTDGQNWERVADPNGVFGSAGDRVGTIVPSGLSAVDLAFKPGGPVVVVGTRAGSGARPVAWTNAGGTWQRTELPAPDNALVTIHAVVATSDGFVAFGQDSRDPLEGSTNTAHVWRSVDGREWEHTGDTLPAGSIILSATTTPDGRIIAVGQTAGLAPNATAWVSADEGRSWDPAAPSSEPPGWPFSTMSDVAAGPQGLLAVGTRATRPQVAVTYENNEGRTLEGEQSLALWWSTDGTNWEPKANVTTPDQITVDPAVVWGDPGFVVAARAATPTDDLAQSWITTSGVQLHPLTHPHDQGILAIAATQDSYRSITQLFDPAPDPTRRHAPPLRVWQLEFP
jgi:hypothetical protein